MKKVYILIANDFEYDNAVFYRAKSIASWGYRVTVLALRDKTGRLPDRERKESFEVLRINVLSWRLPFLRRIKIFRYVEYFFKALIIFLQEGADVYHACASAEMLFMGIIAAKVLSSKAKLIYDTKDLLVGIKSVSSIKDRMDLAFFYLIEKMLIKRADIVIASSDSIAARLKGLYSIGLPLVLRECKPFSRVEGSRKIREVLAIPEDKKIALYFGNICKGRKLEKLVEAAEYLDGSVLVMIGDGDGKKSFIELSEKLNLSDRVRFLGRIPFDEIPVYISSADLGITCMPNDCFNHSYNIYNRLFYYIACGIPVASSNTPERRKLIERYDMGVVFDETSPRDIARVINSMLGDKILYEKLKRNATLAAKADLNWENEARKLSAAYDSLFSPR